MKVLIRRSLTAFLLLLPISAAGQTVTLYVPINNPAKKQFDDSRSGFSFKSGAIKGQIKNSKYDLLYGMLSISGEDWFSLYLPEGRRSVMKDLGEHEWNDAFPFPALEPLPKLAKGEAREFTIDSSADTHRQWAASTTIFAKVLVGHVYLVHVKDDQDDFYALFRVEDLKQNTYCTLRWRLLTAVEEPR